jgi:phosphoribosyl 1,2-cyclic phosphodiesterase
LEPLDLSGIILSHKHLDHSTDVNIMIEAMADGGLKRRGVLLAPMDALEGEDPVVLRYVRPFLERIEVLSDGNAYSIGNVKIRPIRHSHGQVETYGLISNPMRAGLGSSWTRNSFRSFPKNIRAASSL